MLPWLMERESTPVAEVAARFQLTERDVVADLERVAMCGLPPYGPGDLIDLYIEDGVIHIGQRQFLTRPLRLSAPEGFALLVAGRAALQLPGGELAESLRSALDKLATALVDLDKQIPSEIAWVLRVDGHTDVRPINSPLFKSNWELSSARAISVVQYLITLGVPAQRLVAAGFAEFQPLDTAATEEAYKRNRRIELKLTER